MSDINAKSFDFASRRKANTNPETIGKFQVEPNGEWFYIRPVNDSSLAYLIRDISGDSPEKTIAAVLDFMERALVAESVPRFRAAVLDPTPGKGLELEYVVEVFEYVLGVVSDGATPTSPSDSSEPRAKTGSASRAKRSATA